jgi:Ca2+-transporting ATPase
VFARLEPKTKFRIAQTLQKHGHVVAMTGDGVNDALALKQADIGIAMGKVGTEVARQSSDIILTDDNFASILKAVEEGRTVFTNTRQSATFLVSTSLAEHATILGTMAIGLPLPLLPTQILWLNLVTDGISGAPLALEPSHRNSMDAKPRKKTENILSLEVLPFILVVISVMALGTLFVFSIFLPEGVDKARTGAFAMMAFTQLFNIFNVRSLHDSVFAIGLLSNRMILYGLLASLILTLGVLYIPFLQNLFHFVSLHPLELLSIFCIASSVLWLGEVYKYVRTYHAYRSRHTNA